MFHVGEDPGCPELAENIFQHGLAGLQLLQLWQQTRRFVLGSEMLDLRILEVPWSDSRLLSLRVLQKIKEKKPLKQLQAVTTSHPESPGPSRKPVFKGPSDIDIWPCFCLLDVFFRFWHGSILTNFV